MTTATIQREEKKENKISDKLSIVVTGSVVASNLDQHEAKIKADLQAINTNLSTDDDFYKASEMVKRLKGFEVSLKESKEQSLAQMEEVYDLFTRIDNISSTARDKRLKLDKLVKTRREEVKSELVEEYEDKLYEFCEARYKELHISHDLIDIDGGWREAIKGLGGITTMMKALENQLEGQKEAIERRLDGVEMNRELIANSKYPQLFMDEKLLLEPFRLLKKTIEDRVSTEDERLRLEVEKQQAREEQARIEAEQKREREEQQAVEEAERLRLEAERSREQSAIESTPTQAPAVPPINPTNDEPVEVRNSKASSSDMMLWRIYFNKLNEIKMPNVQHTEAVSSLYVEFKQKAQHLVNGGING